MKKVTVSLLLITALLSNNCLGSFNLFNGLKTWNEGVTQNKFLNNLIFWGLMIIPVYGIAFLGDVVIFNVIEFWTGSNPIGMKEGDIEKQIVKKDGKKYEITATKNKFSIEVLEGDNQGEKVEMFYTEVDQSWNALTPQGETVKLSSYKDGFIYVYTPNGKTIQLDANTSSEEGMAKINAYLMSKQVVKN